MPEPQDPTFNLGEEYQQIDSRLGSLSEFELSALAGALVAERVNRGDDHRTALDSIVSAARAGAVGSQMFDQMEP